MVASIRDHDTTIRDSLHKSKLGFKTIAAGNFSYFVEFARVGVGLRSPVC